MIIRQDIHIWFQDMSVLDEEYPMFKCGQEKEF